MARQVRKAEQVGVQDSGLVEAMVLNDHVCEIAGRQFNLKKGEKIKLTSFEWQVLSNPNLPNRIVQAI